MTKFTEKLQQFMLVNSEWVTWMKRFGSLKATIVFDPDASFSHKEPEDLTYPEGLMLFTEDIKDAPNKELYFLVDSKTGEEVKIMLKSDYQAAYEKEYRGLQAFEELLEMAFWSGEYLP